MIAIETGFPVPETRGRPTKYPFGKLEIGESFSVRITGEAYPNSSEKAQQRIMCAAANWKRRGGRSEANFTTRIDRPAGVVRCWRVA